MEPFDGRGALYLAGLLVVVVAGAALGQITEGNVLRRPGVELQWVPGADETYVEPIADVVAVANYTFQSIFPNLPPIQVRVHVIPKPAGWQNTVTDRRDSIYVNLGPEGLGEQC